MTKKKSHNDLIKQMELESHTYDPNEIKKLEDTENPLQDNNHQCFLLKKFLDSHSWLNREDLQNYLNWFCFD
jgi:hypothetical protein